MIKLTALSGVPCWREQKFLAQNRSGREENKEQEARVVDGAEGPPTAGSYWHHKQ